MNRDGFALVSTLWLVAMLAALMAVGLGGASLSQMVAENRIAMRKAEWAARACLALAREAYVNDSTFVPIDSVVTGGATWCDVRSLDPAARVNPNVADSTGLHRLLGDPVAVASLLDWRDEDDVPRDGGAEAGWYRDANRPAPRNGPLVAVEELRWVRGFESTSRAGLEGLFTTAGDGRVSANHASPRVLLSVGLLEAADVERMVATRRTNGPFTSATQVAVATGMDPSISDFQELVRRLSFHRAETVLAATGYSATGRHPAEVRLIAVIGLPSGVVRAVEVS